MRIDSVAQGGRVGLGQQFTEWNRYEVGVAVVAQEIGERELLGLDEQVPVLRIRRSQGSQRLARHPMRYACGENVQDLLCRPCLRGWGQLEDFAPMIVRSGRLAPLAGG